jgi:hypothetical protein
MVTGRLDRTGTVFTVKLDVVWPTGTETLGGTEAAELDDVKFTERPPVGAGEVRVTVPLVATPPATVAGLMVMASTPAALTVRLAVFDVPPSDAVKVAVPVAVTGVVVTLKVALVWPGATGTEIGTVA